MDFVGELFEGTLIRRYKRFLADVQLDNGEIRTIYCPNTGSMRSCSTPGSRVCFSKSPNPARKYPHTLEMIRAGDFWVGVNTGLTNDIVAEALSRKEISELRECGEIRREVRVGERTRLDFMLENRQGRTYVEVKNCSMAEGGVAMFPDAVTARGTKHLLELARLRGMGYGAVIFYLVQRQDARAFRPASHIDPLYGKTLEMVHDKGVEILVYQANVTPQGIWVAGRIPHSLG